MKPAHPFFVISSYNANPYPLTKYASDYRIYDQSNDAQLKALLESLSDPKLTFMSNSGTSLINYLTFIVDNYDDLPPLLAFVKSNLIGRHISLERFETLISRSFYTYLWHEDHVSEKNGVVYVPQSGSYLERNNSWYASLSSHRYFTNFDDFMAFFFANYEKRMYVDFCPGANFIVERERITQHPKELFIGLRHTLKYGFFPSEAWMVERSLNMIFSGEVYCHDWLRQPGTSEKQLESLPDVTEAYVAKPGPLNRLKSYVMTRF